MNEEMKQLTADTFTDCLLNIQCLADVDTPLGRAVLDLPYQLLTMNSNRPELDALVRNKKKKIE